MRSSHKSIENGKHCVNKRLIDWLLRTERPAASILCISDENKLNKYYTRKWGRMGRFTETVQA